MGVVYRARDPELERVVAIKVLRFGDREMPGARERLQREAQSLAQLSHPNVISVFDVGVVQDSVFLAMELVSGQSLLEWQASPRTVPEILAVYEAAGAGLLAAHEAGLVHRDFKPGNVMVGKDGRVRVLDFGLARPIGDQVAAGEVARHSPLGLHLTQTGAFVGTPAYMAPEQLAAQPTDPRTDQYSFCVALYEALYREIPNDPEARQRDGDGAPRFPSSPWVPLRVRRALARGLSARPEARFPSMAEMLVALRPPRSRRLALALATTVLSAAALWFALGAADKACSGVDERMAEVWNDAARQRAQQAFLAINRPYAAGAWQRVEQVLDGYAKSWQDSRRTSCQDTHVRKEQSVERMDEEMRCLDRGLAELTHLLGLFERADDEVVSHALSAAYALPGPEVCLDAERPSIPLPGDPEIQKKIREVQSKVEEAAALNEAGQYERAAILTETAEKEARGVGYAPTLAEVLVERGRAMVKLDRFTEAEPILEEASLQADEAGLDELRFRARLHLLGLVGERLERSQRASSLEREVNALNRRLGPDDLRQAESALTTSGVANALGRYQQGTADSLVALELREKRLPSDHPDLARALLGVAKSYNQRRLGKEALVYADRALAAAEKAFGTTHPELVPFLNERGIALNHTDRWSDSEIAHRRAIDLAIAAYGENHTQVARSLQLLANVIRRMHRFDEGLAQYDRAIAIIEKRHGKHNQMWGTLHVSRGSILAALKRYPEAEVSVKEGLAVLREVLGDNHTLVAWGHIATGMVAQEQKQWQRAADEYARAVAILEELLGKDSPELVYPLHRMAISLDYLDHRRALPVLKRVLSVAEKDPQSMRDLAWARFHTGAVMVEIGGDELEEGMRLLEISRAEFVKNGWDPDEISEIDFYIRLGKKRLAKRKP